MIEKRAKLDLMSLANELERRIDETRMDGLISFEGYETLINALGAFQSMLSKLGEW